MRLNPRHAPAAINLADLYRQFGRDRDGEKVLRTAIVLSPQDAELHNTLGLALVRLKRSDEALGELRRSSELAPEQARYAYVYAVALNSAGHANDAISVLKASLAKHSADRDALVALVTFCQDSGDIASALQYAEELARLMPGDPAFAVWLKTSGSERRGQIRRERSVRAMGGRAQMTRPG